MKNMKKFAFAVLAAVAVCALSGAAFAENRLEKVMRTGKLTVCTEPYFAPYEFIDNTKTGQEQFRGSDMELARFIAQRMGVQLEIVPLAWDAVLSGISQGKYDLAISAMSYTPLRARSMEMSDYYKPSSSGHGIMVRKENADKYSSFDDFDGKTVAYHSGTLQEQLVLEQLPKANKKVFDSVQNAVLAVDAGKVDGVAVSVSNGTLFMEANPNLVILPMRFYLAKPGDVVAATKGEVELIAKVDEIIKEVKEKDLFTQWENAAIEEAAKLGIK